MVVIAYVDLKYVSDAAFCGIVLDSTENDSWGSGATTTPLRADGKYILNSGYGFTLRAGNILEAYISAGSDGTVDAAQFDLSAKGIDASEFNTYAIYRTTEKKAYIAVDDVLVSVMDLAAGAIYEADGTTVGTAACGDPSWTNDDRYNTDGRPFFCIAGDGSTEVYFDNIGYEEFTSLPKFDSKKINATDVSLLQGIGGVGTWIRGPVGSYAAVAVNTLSEFYGFTIPVLWTSNPNNAGHGAIDMKIEVFTFNNTIEDSIGGTALYSVTKTYDQDMAEGDSFIFDNALSAGKYVIAFTQLTADGDGEVARYFVLPSAGAELAFDPFSTIYS